MKHTPLVVGNWKLNPASVDKAKELFIDIRTQVRKYQAVEVAIAPPFPYLPEANRLSPSGRIGIAAQDVFFETTGAYTGEVSMPMLQSVGVRYVIVGHSERRALGETDEDIYKDTKSVLKSKNTAIVCVGEKHRDAHGNYFGVVEAQLRAALRDVTPAQLKYLAIAYEPIWAIGTGNTATAHDASEMKLFIQKLIADQFSRKAIDKVRVLYGGSVKKANAETLLQGSGVDGFLVGGASLKAKEFAGIVAAAQSYAKSS